MAHAEVKVSLTDAPQVRALIAATGELLQEIDLVIGSLEHGDHWDTQSNAAEQLRDAVKDFRSHAGLEELRD